MGKNFFGIEEVIKHYGIMPTKDQLDVLAEIPFSESQLQCCKDTHILAAVLPLSIIDILKITKRLSKRLLMEQDWYKNRQFATRNGRIGWHMVPKKHIDDTRITSARVAVYTIIGHLLATSEWMIEETLFCCRDIITLDSRERRVMIMCDKTLIIDTTRP